MTTAHASQTCCTGCRQCAPEWMPSVLPAAPARSRLMLSAAVCGHSRQPCARSRRPVTAWLNSPGGLRCCGEDFLGVSSPSRKRFLGADPSSSSLPGVAAAATIPESYGRPGDAYPHQPRVEPQPHQHSSFRRRAKSPSSSGACSAALVFRSTPRTVAADISPRISHAERSRHGGARGSRGHPWRGMPCASAATRLQAVRTRGRSRWRQCGRFP
jgi:hypothetical protein